METNNEVKKQKNKPKYATRAYVESRLDEIMKTMHSYDYIVDLQASEIKKNVEASKSLLWVCTAMCAVAISASILSFILG